MPRRTLLGLASLVGLLAALPATTSAQPARGAAAATPHCKLTVKAPAGFTRHLSRHDPRRRRPPHIEWLVGYQSGARWNCTSKLIHVSYDQEMQGLSASGRVMHNGDLGAGGGEGPGDFPRRVPFGYVGTTCPNTQVAPDDPRRVRARLTIRAGNPDSGRILYRKTSRAVPLYKLCPKPQPGGHP